MNRCHRRSCFSSTLAMLAACTPLGAQQPDPPRADGLTGAETGDIYLNDSFEAADALTRARGMIDRGRWEDAAELLQKTSERFADKLHRLSTGHYIGLRDHINDMIAKWPQAGLDAYRALYEPELERRAAAPLSDGDQTELLSLMDRYFCTAGAAKLADRIGQSAIESADLALADYLYRRILEHHPDGRHFTQTYGATLEIVTAMRGGIAPPPVPGRAAQRLRWQGQDRALDEVITEVRDGFASLREPLPASEWPIFAGNVWRSRLSSLSIDELGLLWRWSITGLDYPDEAAASGGDDGRQEDEVSGRELFLQPVASGGFVFVQLGRAVIALHRATGEVAWRFQGPNSPVEIEALLDERSPGWDAVTVHEGRVYASLPVSAESAGTYRAGAASHEIVCLDARSGRVIWRSGPAVGDTRFSEVHFDPSPLATRDHVFVVGRRLRSFGFEDCYLFRLSAASGVIEAQTHLGSAATGGYGQQTVTRSCVTLSDASVYVSTNLGSIAAVSAYTGVVQWLRLYERRRGETSDPANRYRYGSNAWQFNPIIYDDRRLVALPNDSGAILVLSADDGRLLRSYGVESLADAEMLVGVDNDVLCTAGREVACIGLSESVPRFTVPLPPGARLMGRGVRTKTHIAIPTDKGVALYQSSDGNRVELAWDAEGEGGNLVALNDFLLVAGAKTVSVYVRRADVWRVLKEQLDQRPRDPEPALDLAEVALRGGEYDEALAALDEAVRRARAEVGALDTDVQPRIFKNTLLFAGTLQHRSRLNESSLNVLLQYAADFAGNTSDHLTFRLRFADLFARMNKPETAVRLLQQILQDRSLRELPAEAKGGAVQPASIVAQTRIAALIEQFGASIYAPFEADATRWLQTGVSNGDEELLARLVQFFPNSAAAPQALVARGDLLAAKRRANDAARALAQAYHRYPRQVDRPALLRKIADAYEAAGNREFAYLWLTKAAREHPTVLFEHDGRTVGFQQYRARLADVRERVEPRRPLIELPLDGRFVRSLEPGSSLLVPRFPDDPKNQWAQAFLALPDGIMAIDPLTGASQWPNPAPCTKGPDLLIAGRSSAVFGGSKEIFALDTHDGRRRWTVGVTKPEDPGGDWEAQDAFRTQVLHGGQLLAVRDNAQMSMVRIDDGTVLWTQAHKPQPQGRVRLNDRWAVYASVQEGRAVICVIDAQTGQALDRIITDEKRPVEEIFLTLDDQVVLITSRAIAAYDVETRSKRWETALPGQLRRASVLEDIDAMYFACDSGDLMKIGIEDGSILWEAEKILARYTDDVTVVREGSSLLISTALAVVGLDPVNGMILWRGTTPPEPKLAARLATQLYLAALDVASKPAGEPWSVLFYDHRNASGVLPVGGAPRIGPLDDLRAVLAADGALLIQAGDDLHALTQRK